MLLKIKVIPRSSRNEITKLANSEYKVRLAAAPVDGKANSHLIKLLSEEWKIPKSKIKIVSGLTSRHKTIEIPTEFSNP